MGKIRTAEQVLNDYDSFEHYEDKAFIEKKCLSAMREFAKLHVEAALRAVHEKGIDHITEWSGNPYTGEGSDGLSEEKILKAYPLTNIT